MTSPACGWDIDTYAIDGWYELTPEVKQLATTLASHLMWTMTGRRFGVCPVTVRPIAARPLIPTNVPDWQSIIDSPGFWVPSLCISALGRDVTLDGLVYQVTAMMLDGVALTEGVDFVIVEPNILRRTNGLTWPTTQDLTLADSEVGTFSVTYLKGEPPPAGGSQVAGMLAFELAKALNEDDSCQLPARVQQVSRQGVDITFLDPQTFLDQGRTGLPLVDMWVKSVNPTAVASMSDVWSPDLQVAQSVRPAP